MMHLELYSITETATILKCCRRTLDREIKAGALLPVRLRGKIWFTPQEIERYVEAGQVKDPKAKPPAETVTRQAHAGPAKVAANDARLDRIRREAKART